MIQEFELSCLVVGGTDYCNEKSQNDAQHYGKKRNNYRVFKAVCKVFPAVVHDKGLIELISKIRYKILNHRYNILNHK